MQTPSTQGLIELVQREAGPDDDLGALAIAATLAGDLAEMSDAVLGHYVDQARRSGRSWVEISTVLGVSKQAVHRRFALGGELPGFESTRRPSLERFTTRTRNVIKAAAAAASGQTKQDYIGTEHVLLGMYAEPTAVATRILITAEITADRVLEAVRSRTPDGAAPPDRQPPWTSRAADVLVAARAEASKLGHVYIGTEHVLLAFFQVPNAMAGQLLTDLGLGADAARDRVIATIEGFRR